jgi:hypothetical protein
VASYYYTTITVETVKNSLHRKVSDLYKLTAYPKQNGLQQIYFGVTDPALHKCEAYVILRNRILNTTQFCLSSFVLASQPAFSMNRIDE